VGTPADAVAFAGGAQAHDRPWRSWRLQRSVAVLLIVLSRAPTVAGSGQASRGSHDNATVARQCMVTIVALSGAVAAVVTAPPCMCMHSTCIHALIRCRVCCLPLHGSAERECVYPESGSAMLGLHSPNCSFWWGDRCIEKIVGRCAVHDRTPSAKESRRGQAANFRPEIG